MSSDIISSLQLDNKFESTRVIVAKEINGCDSSFLINCVLGHCIKNKNAVLIISMHNSLPHYQNVGLKMNYNLQKYIDSELVHFYNVSAEIVNNLLADEDCSLDKVYKKVKNIITSMKEKFDTVNVILDGISHLFDLQYTLKEVNYFCQEIIKSVREYDNTFILCLCNVASEDDVTHVMSNLLSHKAHIVIDVENLSSGWSADVSGHLTIKYVGRKFEDEHVFNMDMKPSKFLFKLFDRGVKLFAPGTI